MVSSVTLQNFRAAIENATVDVEELEAIMSSSNAGSYCVTGRMEPAFMLAFGLQLLCAGLYIPSESRGVPAFAAAIACFVLCHSCYLASTNGLSVKVFQGEFTKLLEAMFYLNTGFGSLYTMVAVGTFLGFAKQKKD